VQPTGAAPAAYPLSYGFATTFDFFSPLRHMPFAVFKLHPDLLKGIKELGFTRATPIQEQAIPPALEGKDVLACAMTGSGKTAAFLLPILHRLIAKPRGTTRALVLTPTRELAAQIDEHLRQLAVHTPLSGAPVFGGVGMGPQEHAFRSGVDVIIATPGRLLDHFKQPYAKLSGLEVLVLDEADRMLDMGFLPDIKRVLRHLPAKRQTLFFSATMPAPIQALTRELLHSPATINLERKSTPAIGIRQALYPVREELKPALFVELMRRGDIGNVIVFTRTKHRANRLADYLTKEGVPNAKIHGNRSQAQRTEALEGFKAARYRCLVATDIVARGIDVEQLEHVVNFDVPHLPEDYIHRVGRTARADATGDAFTFVSPEEEGDLSQIERAIGKRLPRVVVQGFDYASKPTQRFEVPIAERIAEIRARKADERKRAKEKAERRAANGGGGGGGQGGGRSGGGRPAASGRPATGGSSGRGAPGAARQAGAGSPARPDGGGSARSGGSRRGGSGRSSSGNTRPGSGPYK
jgi:ATP-dependent RNA helicase RhlE